MSTATLSIEQLYRVAAIYEAIAELVDQDIEIEHSVRHKVGMLLASDRVIELDLVGSQKEVFAPVRDGVPFGKADLDRLAQELGDDNSVPMGVVVKGSPAEDDLDGYETLHGFWVTSVNHLTSMGDAVIAYRDLV